MDLPGSAAATPPVDSSRPADPTPPADSSRPADPTPPADSARPADPTPPAGTARPADPTPPEPVPTPADPTPSPAEWSALLPALEAELASEIKLFRKSMKAARILPDFTNRDIFPPSKSGAWEIFHDERTLPDGSTRRFTLYVRRTSDQLAVNEDGGHPYVISPNFTTAFPWALPTADDVRRNMAARMRSLGVRPQ